MQSMSLGHTADTQEQEEEKARPGSLLHLSSHASRKLSSSLGVQGSQMICWDVSVFLIHRPGVLEDGEE